MAGPWEKYGGAAGGASGVEPVAGPWSTYQEASPVNAAQARYDASLEKFRQSQYPNMDPERFKEFAASGFSGLNPANLNDLGQNSVLMGGGDEISSAMGALGSQVKNWFGDTSSPGFGDAYQAYQDLQDARFNLGREKEGVPGLLMEGGAGLLAFGPGRAAIDAAVSGAPAAARALPSLLRTTATSTGTGAAIGAVQGGLSAEGGAQQRAEGALHGAEVGGVLGAALPLAARGASAGWQRVADAWASRQAAERMGVNPNAARFVQGVMSADSSLSPAGRARVQAAGQEGMLADAGPSARNALDYAIQSSGRAGRVARDAIDARVTRDSGAITDALNATLGQPQGVNTMRGDLRAGTSAQRSADYTAAYGQPIDYSSEAGHQLETLLQRVDPAVIRRANMLMRTRGEQSAQIMAEIGDDGAISFRTMPDVRQIDYITRALNEEAQAGIGAGAMGGQTSLGAALTDLSGDIRSTLRDHIPEYDQALRTGQSAIQQSQAVQNGYELLAPGTTREDVSQWLHGYTQADRTLAAQGIRSKLDDALANVTRTVMDGDTEAREAIKALRDLSSRASREKVALVIGDTEAQQLFDELDRAAQAFDLRAGVADNSRTFQRQEMSRRVQDMTDSNGILATVAKGEPVNGVKRVVQALTGMTPDAARARTDEMMVDVAHILTARGPQAIALGGQLSQLGQRSTSAARVAAAIRQLGSAGAVADLASLSRPQQRGMQR